MFTKSETCCPSRPQQSCKPELHNDKVSFREYTLCAQRSRLAEAQNQDKEICDKPLAWFRRLLPRQLFSREAPRCVDLRQAGALSSDEGLQSNSLSEGRVNVGTNEWRIAHTLVRTATWPSAFYLVMTDVLGPYGVGFSLGTLGWVPGIVLYTIFGLLAGYSGYLLWDAYMGLNSHEHPLRNYGDLVARVYGDVPKHIVNVLQSLQLCLTCGQVIIQSGQALSQLSRFHLCYVVCIAIFVAAGFLVSQVRTLSRFGSLAAIALAINILIIIISMGVMAHSPPNYLIAVLGSAGSAVDPSTITPDTRGKYPAVRHYTGIPNSQSLVGSVNGLMQSVYAYGGAFIFIEIMAEMRRPWDFIKSICCAQILIWTVYLAYGSYTYYWQGQYAFQVSFFGLSVYRFSAACDALVVVAGLIVAGLYGNIGVKLLYTNVLIDMCKAPVLTTRYGKCLFCVIVPIYWTVAFIIAASIPDYFGFVSVIAAFCIVPFSYVLPPIIHIGYTIQKNSIRCVESTQDHHKAQRTNGHSKRIKVLSWPVLTKERYWFWGVCHAIFACGALALAGLGAYAAIEGLLEAFQLPQVTSFTCTSPLNLRIS